jgi:hypothetical protein
LGILSKWARVAADLPTRLSLPQASLIVGGTIFACLSVMAGLQVGGYGSAKLAEPICFFALMFALVQFGLLAAALFRRGTGRSIPKGEFPGWAPLLLGTFLFWSCVSAGSDRFMMPTLFETLVVIPAFTVLTFAALSALLGIIYAIGRTRRPSSKEIN